MRAPFIAFSLVLLAGAPAAAESAPSAQDAVFERRALLAADARCGLFAPSLRAALEASAWQARGALLRAGWPSGRVARLEAAGAQSAENRPCADPATQAAAARARDGFAGWARTPSLEFHGDARSWIARRTPDPEGWTLVQTIDPRRAAAFGLMRGENGHAEATLAFRLSAIERAPSSAELTIRDVAQASQSLFEIPGRSVAGLQAGAPSPATARRFLARARTLGLDGRIRFVFPDEALAAMARLDPREAAEIRLGEARQRFLVEVGDLAAARAFLSARQTR